ncbi:MAG: hypothetical protein HC919_00920 [Oscillatoriales cyanobacterium SM2_2_1]|nr:hypothetical protein [Oscillatoriales cyanobacterium SM2_2_1]
MAKRRNQKKEKALRNLAYARKFRKRTPMGRFGRRRSFGGFNDAEDGDMVEGGENSGATDLGDAKS